MKSNETTKDSISQNHQTQELSTSPEHLLEDFIQEYNHAKTKILQGSNPLYALIDEVKYHLSQVAPLDSKALHSLNTLTQSIQEPMKVAIIGQFSSGKSTFLNALLGQSILPSGITPITAKVCHIAYGSDYALEIMYKNGNTATKPLSYLEQSSEAENAKIAFYKLYAPLSLLKSINFLDTPGFNSLNQSDTDTTNAVLESVDGIIWLTLIDNVGKQSEKDIILSHIKRYASKSLCVLNQKDRLKNQDEIDTSLSYAKKAFNGFFEEIIAISAREALLSHSAPKEEAQTLREHSCIDAVINFLQTHIAPQAQSAKHHSICMQLRALTLTYARLSLYAHLRFKHLESLLINTPTHFSESYPQSAFYTSFPAFFYSLESKLESLTQHIYGALERSPREFVRIDKKFGIKTQNKQTKDIITLPRERLSLSLCGADSSFSRDFIKLGFDITAAAEQFNALLNTHIDYLRELITQWYRAFLPPLQSPLLQKTLDEIINAYEHLASVHSENLKAQLMLFAKILTLNYPLAVHLCLNTIALKIQEALDKYTKSPDTLPLFNPTLENIRDELNLGFSFGFLQENLLTQPLHKKSLWHFEREAKALCQKQSASISAYKEQYAHHFEQLKTLLNRLKKHKPSFHTGGKI
ncbi:MAG: dynamin family protein [Helicobacter sp.]|uniref:dynamin family protein n=1 Tax=Helicobacter sp. TaxID=218 RepID=UPI0025C0CE37|nr:dynamin family protein [Helicobacter sp.]MCH5314057.1 dynamin family protein [Helicobacter sp.]